MEIEGYLKKWTNYISGWQMRYFMLKDGILYYCNKKDSPVKGTIHMKICKFELSPNDPLKISINSGTKAILLKTESVSDKLKWLNALRASKEEIQQYDTSYTKIKTSNIKPEILQKFIEQSTKKTKAESEFEKKGDYMKMINKTISDIWEQQVKLDSALNFLALKFDSKKHAKIIDIIEKTANEGAELIKRVTYCVNIIENEKRRISKIGKEIEEILEKDKNAILNEKIILKLKNITNLKDCDYPPLENDSENNNFMEETINDFMPEQENNKDVFVSFANQNIKEIDELFNRASIINIEEEKALENLEILKENSNKIEDEQKSLDKTPENKEKSVENNQENIEKVQENIEIQPKEENIYTKAEDISLQKPENITEKDKKQENCEEEFKNNEISIAKNYLHDNISQSLQEILKYLKETCPIKYNLITTNFAYKNLYIPTAARREKLPFFRNANEKFNIWSIIKDSLGKDLSKIAVPVYLNEPLSMLQRFAEQFEYSELLDKASEAEDPGLRMAYVVAFGFSPYSATMNRLKKPFNPLLGETFELFNEEKGFRLISEQVSHHPPISAGYCESKNYKYWSNTNVKTSFWGKSIEFKPLGVAHLIVNKYNDHFIYTKATSSAENLLIGNMYVDNHGEMNFTNLTTNDTAVLNLKKRGWNNKNAYEATGVIKDSAGNVLYKIKARWDKYLSVYKPDNEEQEIMIWEKNPEIAEANQQFYFTNLTLQLNYLNEYLLKHIAPTDSRLRPDQRSLEFGDKEFALEEKKRLEEKQRNTRKEREEKNEEWIPKWFKEENDELTNSKTYIYKGGYWEQREKGIFDNALDLF